MTLSFEQTVPRSLVHRAALGEVYVADSARTGEGEFALAIQIPRAHCVWFDRRAPYHDPLATAEAARQGVYVVVHRYVGVPSGAAFSLRRLELRVEDLERYRDHGLEPLQGLLVLRLVERAALGTMTFEGEISIGGGVAVSLAGDLVWMAADDFAALRAYQRRRATGPADPPAAGRALDAAASGRLDRRNSVLGAPATGAATSYPVIVDQRHPSFFDHPYDHAPGPLIVEAFRQAAIVTAHRAGALASPVAALVGCSATFTQFAELDARIECEAEVVGQRAGGRARVELGLQQFGRRIASGQLELQPYPAGTPVD